MFVRCSRERCKESFIPLKMPEQPRLIVLIVCLAAVVRVLATKEYVVRNTEYGRIQGYVSTVLGWKKVEVFLGVPYAAPPIGELRFEYNKEPTPWIDIRNTTSLPPACPQTGFSWAYTNMNRPGHRYDDEDCLYMNIYVPKTGGAENKMEVLVHIHGGSNVVGMGAMFDGDVLAAMGEMIIVTFNYRLGLFGFLSGETSEFPGNYGLVDQVAALKWVSRNIHYFGGDPTKVTVEGHSAGGADVGFHLLSSQSKGLFRYAIMQSGSPAAHWAVHRPPTNTSFTEIVERLGCSSSDILNVKKCLKTKDWKELKMEKYEYNTVGVLNFAPVLDDAFLTSLPETAILKQELNGESFMTGVTRDEGSIRAMIEVSKLGLEGDAVLTPASVESILSFEVNSDLVVYEYKPWDNPRNKSANFQALSGVSGDASLVAPSVDWANRLSEKTENIYFYSFEYHSPLPIKPTWMKGPLGVYHGRDLFYLFGTPFSGHPFFTYSDEDREVSRTLINMWSNFVKTGKPSLGTDKGKTEFPNYEMTNQTYMKITGINGTGSITTAQRLRPRKVAFWNYLLPRMRKNKLDDDTAQTYGSLMWILAALCGVLVVCLIISIVCMLRYRRKMYGFLK